MGVSNYCGEYAVGSMGELESLPAGTDRQCKQKDGSHKQEPERNARDQNTLTEMKAAFDGLIRLDMAEMEDLSIETSKIKTK